MSLIRRPSLRIFPPLSHMRPRGHIMMGGHWQWETRAGTCVPSAGGPVLEVTTKQAREPRCRRPGPGPGLLSQPLRVSTASKGTSSS